MNILIARKDIKNIMSGVPKNILRQAELFTALRKKVFIIAERMDSRLIESTGAAAVKTLRWPISGYGRRKFYQYQVSRWIARHAPDLVVGHGDIKKQDVLLMHNCTHLAHELIYGTEISPRDEMARIHSEILAGGEYRLLICNSRLMQTDFIRRFRIPPHKTEVIYQEINPPDFQVADKSIFRKSHRESLGIKEGETVVGFITSGDFRKRNLEGLLKAFGQISGDHPGLKLLVAGGEDPSKYKDLAARAGIAGRVVFAPAVSDVKIYYHVSDIFVLPAHIEEFGKSVLEAMYCGLPVIVSATVGASEIIEGPGRDFIVESSDTDRLGALMGKLAVCPELRYSLGELNHKTSLKYTSGKMMAAFYNTLVGRHLIPPAQGVPLQVGELVDRLKSQ